MERSKFIRECVIEASKELGYPVMKPEQVDIVLALIVLLKVEMCLLFFQPALERACVPARQ